MITESYGAKSATRNESWTICAERESTQRPALRRADGGEQQGENNEATRDLCLFLRLTASLRTVGNSCKPLPIRIQPGMVVPPVVFAIERVSCCREHER